MTISVRMDRYTRFIESITIFFEKDPEYYMQLWSDGYIIEEFSIGDYWWGFDGNVRMRKG